MSDSLSISTIRCLTADIIQKANSGHPGAPLGMAPIAHVLWSRIMNYCPSDPKHPNRDRFVLSNGHACSLLYAMLHLCGYDMTMDDLKSFRQLNSKTPGHPEAHHGDGIEVTTGPLGQGISNAIGLAWAGKHMGAVFNKPDFDLFNHFVYALVGDGCLQEGVAAEASSLAGHWKLDNLIVLYDDNSITIDGSTNLSFSENVVDRFQSYGWHVQTVLSGNDIGEIEAAIQTARDTPGKPHFIAVKTQIGFGSPWEGTAKVHGSPLGVDGVASTKEKLGMDPTKFFNVPDEIYSIFRKAGERGTVRKAEWESQFALYAKQYPELAAECKRRFEGTLPINWKSNLPSFDANYKQATRKSSGVVLNSIASVIPDLVGGSADLTPSNLTALKCSGSFAPESPANRYIHFGVREHAMVAIGNGISAYGGLIPFTATFFNFISYALPAVRLAALSNQRHLLIMTHDSIGVGEDGPTHQPIESLALCRATPNLLTLRPADAVETTGAYVIAVENINGPSVIALTRQSVPNIPNSNADSVALGAYVIHKEEKECELILVSTGSEVSLCIETAKHIGAGVRVVSMPCWELFDKQTFEYRRSVIVPGVPTISVEAATALGWHKYSHMQVSIETYGASAPLPQLNEHFGFTVDAISDLARKAIPSYKIKAESIGNANPFASLPCHF